MTLVPGLRHSSVRLCSNASAMNPPLHMLSGLYSVLRPILKKQPDAKVLRLCLRTTMNFTAPSTSHESATTACQSCPSCSKNWARTGAPAERPADEVWIPRNKGISDKQGEFRPTVISIWSLHSDNINDAAKLVQPSTQSSCMAHFTLRR